MQFIAIQKNTRQTPRKVRLVANQIKDLPLESALKQLAVIQKKSTLVLLKTIKQAIANAKNNHGVAPKELEIKEITVGDAAKYKRFRAVSRGRAHNIIKRACNVKVVLQKKTVPVAGEEKDVKKKSKVVAKPVGEKTTKKVTTKKTAKK